MFVGMVNESPFCTADTHDEAYRGAYDIAHKLGWLGPKVKIAARIWVEEVPHLCDGDSE